ncbi:hypothetical protein [Nocardiopsis coralliicola]
MSRAASSAADPRWTARVRAALEAEGAPPAPQSPVRVVPGEVQVRIGGPDGVPVSLIRPVLDDADWARAAAALASQPLFGSRILAGVLPPETEQVFAVLGLALLPDGIGGTLATCACPAWGGGCGHITAAAAALADRAGRDPFLLTAWLGRDRGALQAAVREAAGGGPSDRVPAAEEAPGGGDGTAPDSAALPSPGAFWAVPEIPALPELPAAPTAPSGPAAQWAPPPDGLSGLPGALGGVYAATARQR